MPPETSAALVVFDEQPAIVPRTTAASKPKHGLSLFIFLLYDIATSSNLLTQRRPFLFQSKNGTERPSPHYPTIHAFRRRGLATIYGQLAGFGQCNRDRAGPLHSLERMAKWAFTCNM